MSTKAQVKTQAKTSAAPAAARIPQPPVAAPEHEAERPDIAAQLEGAARLGHSLGAVGVASPAPPTIQRQELPEEEEEELQLKREPAAIQRQELPEEEEEELMLKPEEGRVGPQGGEVPPDLEAAIQRARGGGQPLDDAVQAHMSEALGHDFSGVRVHTDSEADALTQQLQAKAFTTRSDIFFRGGAYEPASRSGRELIAHELSHVVQQSSGRGGGDGGRMKVSPAGDAFEHEADEQARRVALQRGVPNPTLAAPADILDLRRTGGNRGGRRLLATSPHNREAGRPTRSKLMIGSIRASRKEDGARGTPEGDRGGKGKGSDRPRQEADEVNGWARVEKNGGAVHPSGRVQRMAVVMEPDQRGHKRALAGMDIERPLVEYLDIVLGGADYLVERGGTRLTMFGHAEPEWFGNMGVDELVADLQANGLGRSTIKTIELIGCAATVKGSGEAGVVTRSYAEGVAAKGLTNVLGDKIDVRGLGLPRAEDIRVLNEAGLLDSRMFIYLNRKEYLFIVGERGAVREVAAEIQAYRGALPKGLNAARELALQKAEVAMVARKGPNVFYLLGELSKMRTHLEAVGAEEGGGPGMPGEEEGGPERKGEE